MFWCWSYVWSYVLMLVLCSDALWPFLSVLLNICVCGSMIVCCTHSAAFCVYVCGRHGRRPWWQRSQFLGEAHPRGNVRSYIVWSHISCVFCYEQLMGASSFLWVLWSEFCESYDLNFLMFCASPVRQAFSCGRRLPASVVAMVKVVRDSQLTTHSDSKVNHGSSV